MSDNFKDDDGLGDLGAVRSSSVAVATAKALRDEILRRADGDLFLGSEDQLLLRLGVSRPTFRQAARLLEYEELLIIRRGVGGGFFGRKPSAEVVARMAGIYLLAQGTSFADVVRAQFPLRAEILRLLAGNADPSARARLSAFVRENGHLQRPSDIPSAVRAINSFWRLASDLAGNNALALFIHTSQAYGAKAGGLTLNAARISVYVGGMARIAKAVEVGDADTAIKTAREFNEKMLSWMADDLPASQRKRKPRGATAPS
jgi:GntR family transcriptional repressor for pyruvate dehydrogenase complex